MNRKIIQKPWGHEEIWAQTPHYVGKFLCINAGHRLSLQFHREKVETITPVFGTVTVLAGPDVDNLRKFHLSPGESFHVEPGLIHRFCADDTDVTLCEVSTTQLDDVVRIADDFNR